MRAGWPVATRLGNVQFRDMVRPGDAIRIEVDLTEVGWRTPTT